MRFQTRRALEAAYWVCELLWPSRCGGCNETIGPDAGFCDACQVSVLTLEGACHRCGLPQHAAPNARAGCDQCLTTPWHLDATRCGAQYGGALITAIVQFKHGRHDLLRPLAQLLVAGLSELNVPEALLVPVPLHPRRLRQRGFNQAWELARRAAYQLPAPIRPRLLPQALVRIRDSQTPKQGRIEERRARAEGAFAVAQAHAIRERPIIMVDDVLTTGATLNACATALKQAGARSVSAVAVARAV